MQTKKNSDKYLSLNFSYITSAMLATTLPVMGLAAVGLHIYAAYKIGIDAFLDFESDFYTIGIASVSAFGTRHFWKKMKEDKIKFDEIDEERKRLKKEYENLESIIAQKL